MNVAIAAKTSPDFVISRTFDAPRDLVWTCFTDAEHLKHWWGPKGFTVTHAKVDLRPGGTYHYAMKAPDGSTIWGKFVFREIAGPERMVFVNSFSDEAGGTTRHPGHASWPLEMVTVFTFEDVGGGKTRFTTRWTALNASPEEQKTFDTHHDSMRQGWTGTLDQLQAYLARV